MLLLFYSSMSVSSYFSILSSYCVANGAWDVMVAKLSGTAAPFRCSMKARANASKSAGVMSMLRTIATMSAFSSSVFRRSSSFRRDCCSAIAALVFLCCGLFWLFWGSLCFPLYYKFY